MEYLCVAASWIRTSVFTERLLQLHTILKKLLFLIKSTDLTGLNYFKAGYEAGHTNRVLTRGQSGRPKFKKNKYYEVLWHNHKLSNIWNEIQSLLLMSLTKSFFDKSRRRHRPLVKSLLKQPASCLACTWIRPVRPVNTAMIFVTIDALRNITFCKVQLYCGAVLQHYWIVMKRISEWKHF